MTDNMDRRMRTVHSLGLAAVILLLIFVPECVQSAETAEPEGRQVEVSTGAGPGRPALGVRHFRFDGGDGGDLRAHRSPIADEIVRH